MSKQRHLPCDTRQNRLPPDLDARISKTLIELRRSMVVVRDGIARDATAVEVEALVIVGLSLDLIKSTLCMHLRSGIKLPSATIGLAYLLEDEALLNNLCNHARTGACPLIPKPE